MKTQKHGLKVEKDGEVHTTHCRVGVQWSTPSMAEAILLFP